MYKIFDKLGVFEKFTKSGDLEFRFVITKVERDDSDPLEENILISYGDDDEYPAMYPVDLEDMEMDDEGNLHFSMFDGDYVIRGLKPEDGRWVSTLKTEIPKKAVEYVLENQRKFLDKSLGDGMSRELLVAYSKEPNSGKVFGVEYHNSDLGQFVRANGMWVLLSADDETFEDMFATFIDPDKADDFIEAFDKGGMTVEDADGFARPKPEVEENE